ncbi:hypothetical protein AVEN_52222-1 [Araneus ventricosus]|uniref:Uncharacterized protein n=1 Tax=Araneus ventricosus TaxID=182803 RepID=A0A4Y2SZL0_ARAVE|nr:hypothetical protein AVEN_52222-1 [Araneus ventricosus]
MTSSSSGFRTTLAGVHLVPYVWYNIQHAHIHGSSAESSFKPETLRLQSRDLAARPPILPQQLRRKNNKLNYCYDIATFLKRRNNEGGRKFEHYRKGVRRRITDALCRMNEIPYHYNGYEGTVRCNGYEGTVRCNGYEGTVRCNGYEGTVRCNGYEGTVRRSGYEGTKAMIVL